MKVSHKQLTNAVSRMKSDLLSYKQQGDDLAIEFSFTQEDPGNGVMVDCLTLKATRPVDPEKPEEEVTMSIEVYPYSEKIDPVGKLIKSFKVLKPY